MIFDNVYLVRAKEFLKAVIRKLKGYNFNHGYKNSTNRVNEGCHEKR